MNLSDELLLNQLAQGVLPMKDGAEWFAARPADRQQDVLRWLANAAVQAGARTDDAEVAIAESGLRPTATPCVLLAKENLPVRLAKIVNLPAAERGKAFALLTALFGVADRRRRTTQCACGCSHWWHRDLGDAGVVEELLAANVA
ncbi:MAG: DUF5958 family protein [Gemmataceae bacterium]